MFISQPPSQYDMINFSNSPSTRQQLYELNLDLF